MNSTRSYFRQPSPPTPHSRLVNVLLLAMMLLLAGILPSRGQAPSEVLILNSYHSGYAWSDGELRGLLKTLLQDRPEMLPSIEYLDWKRQPTIEQEQMFLQMLDVRYGEANLRVVVTLDDKAFELALRNRNLFGDVPIVFGGINHFDPEAYAEPLTNVTGVAESKDFYRTLDLIRKLQPNVREIVGYHDNTESAMAHRLALQEVIPHFAPHLRCRFIENWTKDELLDELGQLPPDAVAFSLGATRDRDGVLIADDLDFLNAVSRRCAVPIYMISEPVVPLFSDVDWNDAVWCGVGGSLVSSEQHGEEVGQLVLRVLRGEHAGDIPVATNSAGRLAVDWRQMKRFNLPFHALPEHTEVFNRPENFYRVHKSSILIGLLVLGILAIAVVVLAVNIMLRRRAERENTHLGAAVEQAEEIVIMLDAEGRVTYINPAFARITGWPEKAGRTALSDCMGSDGADDSFSRLIERLRKDKSCSSQLECRHRNGHTLQLHITGSSVRDASDKIAGYILIARDITHETALMEQVRNSQKMEAVGLLAGGVAHDFNNLLQVVMGHAQLAMDPSCSETERESSLALLLAAAKRGAKLPKQLLAFGRRQPLNMQDTNLNTFVKEVLQMLDKLIGEHIDVEFLPEPAIGNIRADHGQLEQVLLNLCVNARDAMPATGKLCFRLENATLDAQFCNHHPWARSGRYACLHVTDTGCGMDEATLDRVFEPFFTTKPVDKGTGLGLAVVYGIMQQHNGLLRINSTPEVGTTVSLYLPHSEPGSENKTPDPVETSGTAAAGTILLVEDETSVRDLCARILTHAGYSVLEAKNGIEAVDCFTENADEIDLVLMDMVMPKMSGPEASERMAEIRPDVPVLFSSGYSADWIDPRFGPQQNAQVIQKPYDAITLLSQIDSTLTTSA